MSTALSEDTFRLAFDGSVGRVPGVTGGFVDAVSKWVESDTTLVTDQFLDDLGSGPARPDDARAAVFRTERSLASDGSLREACSVVRGASVAATCLRLLRRVS